jgi:DNA-directed RNA polymerase subunit M/transcription elongation factor TFIIS
MALLEEVLRLREQLAKSKQAISSVKGVLFKDFELIPSAGCLRHKTTGEIACPKCRTEGILTCVAQTRGLLPDEVMCSCNACGNKFSFMRK